MTNEISNMMRAQQVPVRGSETGQVVELDTVKNNSSQELPDQGKQLPQQADKVQLEAAVSKINNVVQSVQRDLTFNLDEDSGHTVIKVIDTNSGKLVRQIPTVEVLAIASYIQDNSDDSSFSGGQVPPGMLFSDNI